VYSNVPVIGYALYMDDGFSGDFALIFNGTHLPLSTSHTAYNLTTGLSYRFYV
jgi:hypothetical protein